MAFLRALFKPYQALIDSPRRAMTVFSICVVIFFMCAAMMYSVNQSYEPSLEQEKALFGWFVLGSISFFIAINAQICMVIHRFKNMGKR